MRSIDKLLRQPARWTAIILLTPMLSIGACATRGPVPEKPVLVNRQPPAELVTKCPREPLVPDVFLTEKERLMWALKARAAGAACRAQSDKQGEWMTSPPT